MKKKALPIVETLLWIIMIWTMTLRCGGDDTPPTPTPQEEAYAILSGGWSISQGGGITLDGHDVSLNYSRITLSFSDGVYVTNNAGNLFSARGVWNWADEAARFINLDDGTVLNIVSLTAEEFVFSFQLNSTRGVVNGPSGISGNYVIAVNKN